MAHPLFLNFNTTISIFELSWLNFVLVTFHLYKKPVHSELWAGSKGMVKKIMYVSYFFSPT